MRGSQLIQSSRSLSLSAAPDQHGTAHRQGSLHRHRSRSPPLPNGVSSGSPPFEIVPGIEGSAELGDLELGVGLPDFEIFGVLIARRADVGR